jgi:uncharacterized protein YcgL (UPF0745 family)
MPPTKITVNLKPDRHLQKSDINKVISRINEFIFSIVK